MEWRKRRLLLWIDRRDVWGFGIHFGDCSYFKEYALVVDIYKIELGIAWNHEGKK